MATRDTQNGAPRKPSLPEAERLSLLQVLLEELGQLGERN